MQTRLKLSLRFDRRCPVHTLVQTLEWGVGGGVPAGLALYSALLSSPGEKNQSCLSKHILPLQRGTG